jgi:DNA-binding CsgD family transcriptional regulator
MRRPAKVELDGSQGPPGTRHPVVIPRPRRSTEDVPSLNDRDRELLHLLADGRSTPQIAAAMAVTSNTARTRIRRVQRKLAASHRRDLVAEARQLGAV